MIDHAAGVKGKRTLEGQMIAVEEKDGLWRVTINRPEKANALTKDMLAELAFTMERAKHKAQVVVLTGAGKVFSAGADLEEAGAGLAVSPLWERLSGAIAALPCLTICALNGSLAGGAMGMALACDLRLAVPQTKIFYPVMRLGFMPQPSDPKRMIALIGPARSKMILMAGQKITAEEALAWGLVDRIVAPEALEATSEALAQDALAATPAHVLGIKALCQA